MQLTVDILSEIAHGSLDILMFTNLLFISTSEGWLLIVIFEKHIYNLNNAN